MSNKILNKQIQFPLSGSFTGSLFGTASYALFAENGGGGTGSNATASFNNQSVWTFNHNLGTLLVTIQTLDADYRQILPQSIQLIDTASAVITFPVTKSGWAIASLGGAGSTGTTGLLTTALFNSYTGSNTSQFAGTSSFASTASYVLQSVSASFASTASFIKNAVSASFATFAQTANTASYVVTAQTASYVLNAVSASFAATASYFSGSITNAIQAVSASYATQASNADLAQVAFTAFSALTAQTATSATNATSASYATLAAGATLAQTANTAVTATTAQTATLALTANTASYVKNAQTASFLLNNIDFNGSLRLYVSPSGSDSNDGTQPTKSFRTIKAAVESIGAINPLVNRLYTIFVSTGDYKENNPIIVPPGVAIVGDNLKTVRLTAVNPRKDYFHCHGASYFYGLRIIDLQYPSFAFSFPCSTATGSVNGSGQVSSLSIVHSATGYPISSTNLDIGIIIESPDSISGSATSATATVNTDITGSITAINLTYSGSNYAVGEKFHVSIPAPSGSQPYIFASPYIQNCTSITGPFTLSGIKIPATDKLPWDVTNVSGSSIDSQGAGGGIRVDGNLPNPASPLQSFVADSFTQVNQGGPGHLIINNGYAQLVSCFTTFSTYGFKVAAGGYGNISNSVCDFGNFGLISKKNFPIAYNTASVAVDKTSIVASLKLITGGNGYSASAANTASLTITGGGGSNATAYGTVVSGSITELILMTTGSGYTTVPSLVFPTPTSGSLLVTATGSVSLSGVTEFLMNLVSGSRGVDISSNMSYSGSNYIVTGVVAVDGQPDQRKITVYPSPPSIVAPNTASFTQLSNISTGGLVMEYVGSGVTYNSLPKFGGVPNSGAEITEIAPGKVFYATIDNVGNFKVGPYFGVNQLTGEITISTDRFNLAGIASIGPFKRDGNSVGVALKEVSNSPDLLNSVGSPGQDTAPTQYAVKQYIIGQGLSAGNITGNAAGTAATASYVTGSIFNSTNPALSASYALTASYALFAANGGGGGGGVTSIIAGTNITIDPPEGTGNVTITSAGGGGGTFPFNGAAVITGSLVVSGSGVRVTGSLNVTNGITGSLLGTAATASNITPAFTAGNSLNSVLTANGDGKITSNNSLVFNGTNLGIGKTAPTATLDVLGTTNLSGSLTVTGSLFLSSSAATLGQFAGNQNGFAEFSVRNNNTGISASGDIVVYANNGTVSNNYIDMGINNSGMTSSYSFFGTDFGNANDAYLYNVGGNLRIGNATSVTPFSQSLYLFSNPTATPNIWITGSQVAIGKSTGYINGTLDISGSTVITGSLSIDGSLRQPVVSGSQLYAVNLQHTLTNTTSSQTQTAFRILSTFTGSFSGSNTQNIIADFGATSVGTQFSVNDTTSGSIYLVNDVSGLPIIEATSNWDVNIYDYPNIILQKTGSSIIISGSLRMTPSSSFVLPLTASSAPALGSAYWSGSFLFIYNGTRYMSSSFS